MPLSRAHDHVPLKRSFHIQAESHVVIRVDESEVKDIGPKDYDRIIICVSGVIRVKLKPDSRDSSWSAAAMLVDDTL